MRNKLSVLGALIVSMMAFISCGGDETSANNELSVFGQKFSLNGATFYEYSDGNYDKVIDESQAATHKYVGLEVFDNATYADESEISYYGYIQLFWPIDEEVGDDEFDFLGDDDSYTYTATSRTAEFYVYFDFPEGSTYGDWPSPYKWVGVEGNSEEGTSFSIIETSEGNIQVKFSGPLEYWTKASTGWTWVDEDLKDTKISVEGPMGTIPNVTRMNAVRHTK